MKMVQKKSLFRVCFFIFSCVAIFSCKQEQVYYRNQNSIPRQQRWQPNYQNNYRPYQAPNSRAYQNPYDQNNRQYYQYYDQDQYYVPPTNYHNQEPDHRYDPNMKL